MPVALSTPGSDASMDAPKLAAQVKRDSETLRFFELLGETTTKVAAITPKALEVEQTLSGHLASGGPLLQDQVSSAGTRAEGKGKVIGKHIPKLEGLDDRHDLILTNSVRKLLRTLWAIVVSRALQINFPLSKTAVSIFEDPTERERKAVLRLVCKANASQALAFWDSLETDLQDWVKMLTENDRTTFITKLGLRVHWQ